MKSHIIIIDGAGGFGIVIIAVEVMVKEMVVEVVSSSGDNDGLDCGWRC